MLISISTHKGGAGKTTIATNLACSLAINFPNKSVCLVDLDGQCGVSICFGSSPKKYIGKSILSIINKSKPLSEIIDSNICDSNKNPITNLSIIYSEPDLRGFDHIINQNLEIKDNLSKTLQFLKKTFDYVIVDTPPAFSTINILTFMESDIIISPFEPERQNIEGSLAVINELKKPDYTNKPIIYLLPIKVKERTLIDQSLLQYVDDLVNIEYKDDHNITLSIYKIPNSTQYKSTNAREKVPLIISKAKSKAVEAQKQLIKEITLEIANLLAPAERVNE